MVVTCVYVYVKPEFLEDFKKATTENYENTRKEPGNLRFDFLQQADEPTTFMLYEVFESEDAVLAHKETAHYKKWRDTVAPWMAQPRKGVKQIVLQPMQKELW